jgi:23S rRNA (guanosine2251-2'-O)-methyltransferase
MKLDTVFGIHAVTALLQRTPNQITEIWIQKGRSDHAIQPILDLAQQHEITLLDADKGTINQKADGNHQGVLALRYPMQKYSEKNLADKLDHILTTPSSVLILVLDGITDPHNLGACIRTADAAGVQLIIAPKDRSAPLNATVTKVACGGAESVPYIQVTNLARTLKNLQERGVWISGTAGEASQSIYQTSFSGPTAIVMGSEGKGLRRLTKEYCDNLIHIPMAGEVSSLNVSVATGICLFEVVRQKTLPNS